MYWPMLRPSGRKSEMAVGSGDPFTALRREMDRVFESFGRELGWPSTETSAGVSSICATGPASEQRRWTRKRKNVLRPR